jgi:hypothetical protein
MIAAKYATECNITVRNHVPVLKHWREYNENPAVIDLFLGTLRVSTLSQSFSLFRCNKNYFFFQKNLIVNVMKAIHFLISYFLYLLFLLKRQSLT